MPSTITTRSNQTANTSATPLAMSLDEYAKRDALGLMQLLKNGEVTAQELHDLAQAGIDRLNPDLNFLISRTTPKEISSAIADANTLSPFGGLPFLVKEGNGMKGQPLALGTRLADRLVCEEDSEIVRRFKKTGVVILGSTNTPEFGNSSTTESALHGPVHNPWNLKHMCGGSSGGGAAAVAAGIIPVADTSDGGGSIRTPAHCCGIFGLKPTRARTSVGPGFGGIYSLGVTNVSSRTVRDSAAFLDELQGPEVGALYHVTPPERPFLQEVGADPRRLRIAFSAASPSHVTTSSECVTAVEKAATLCDDLGHDVEEAAPLYEWDQFMEPFLDLWVSGMPSRVAILEKISGRKAGPDTLEISTLACLEEGRSLSVERLINSLGRLHAIVRKVDNFFSKYDVFISPVNLTPAPKLGTLNANAPGLTAKDWLEQAISRHAPFPPIFNATGQPAMSVPLHHSADGLPVGVQCVARYGDEATLFRLAAQMEAAMPWIDRRPPHSLFA